MAQITLLDASESALPQRLERPDHNLAALAAINEMLERLETVTRAGQRHLMNKILAVLTSHPLITAAGPFIADRVDDLRREAEKAAPDGGAFTRATRALFTTARILGD